jgi:hypothetical protein
MYLVSIIQKNRRKSLENLDTIPHNSVIFKYSSDFRDCKIANLLKAWPIENRKHAVSIIINSHYDEFFRCEHFLRLVADIICISLTDYAKLN